MAGKTLVRPENGRFHGIYRSLARLGPKNHIKIFFKVGAKIAKKKKENFFFDPPKIKKLSVQKISLYKIF